MTPPLSTTMSRPDMMPVPPLIPAPAEIHPRDSEAFTFGAGTQIVLGQRADDETLFAARQTQAAVREATGLLLPVRKSVQPRVAGSRIELLLIGRDQPAEGRDDPPEGRARSTQRNPSSADDHSQAYELDVSREAITISSTGEAGLFYGVQTLKQLLRTCGARVPALNIRDRPAMPHRGVMLDVSRGKVPTLATLIQLVDGLAAHKYNQLQLYVEHTFDFPSHPDIGAGSDPLTADDMLALDAACRERHVELVPNLQSFGHQRRLLSLPKYSFLDEVGWRWSLTPAREETYRLLDELYADFLPAFTSGWLNVDCDETWDLAMGQSAALAAEVGKGRVYLGHILRLRELAARYGRRIMLWADVLHSYPELVGELPDDVLLLDWQYEAADHYATTDALGESGRAFWVCPGTSSWNTLFPRLDNALGNIRNFVRDGLAAGASGMLLTDWGDYGHYQPLSASWYPYLFGAATAWTGARTSPEEFDVAFAPLFLGRPVGDSTLGAMRRLGAAVAAPTLGSHNRSASALGLFDDPLNGELIRQVAPAALDQLEAAAVEAAGAWAALPDPALRHDYGFLARLILFVADKIRTSQQVRDGLHLAASSGGAQPLDQHIAALAAVRARLPEVRAEFETVWMRHARRSEIHLTLDHFDALDAHYAAAIAWLEDQRARLAARQPVDADLATYAPGPYFPLWQQGIEEQRRLRELTG